VIQTIAWRLGVYCLAATIVPMAGAGARNDTQQASELTVLQDAFRTGGVPSAVSAYEQLTRKSGHPDPVLLAQLAGWTAAGLAVSDDELVRNSACAATVPFTRDKQCISTLQAVMGDGRATFAIRLMAANALRRAGDPFAQRGLAVFATEAAAQNPIDAAPLLREVNPDLAVPLLSQMLASGEPQQQQAAASVLAEIPGKAAMSALASQFDRLSGSAKIAAVAGLAAGGDAEARVKLTGALSLLQGQDLLTAAIALQRLQDPKATGLLLRLLASDDVMLKLEAAGHLAKSPGQERAWTAIHSGLASRNPLVRAQALKIWADAGRASDATVRRLLGDDDPWVRLQAAAILAREGHIVKAPKP
jgi:HEAT repeat protein